MSSTFLLQEDWDLPANPRRWRESGRAFAYGFWSQYVKCLDIFDWTKKVRGYDKYPMVSDPEAWVAQTGFLLYKIQPIMDRLLRLRERMDADVLADLKCGLRPSSGLMELQAIDTIRKELHELWPRRPKKRVGVETTKED